MKPTFKNPRTNSKALPSIIGISGPFTSSTALFIPQPASAAITCSTVDTLVPTAFSNLVHNAVCTENCQLALINALSSALSVLRNQIPDSPAAGLTHKVTSLPVCKPVPVNVTAVFKVFCKTFSTFLIFFQNVYTTAHSSVTQLIFTLCNYLKHLLLKLAISCHFTPKV